MCDYMTKIGSIQEAKIIPQSKLCETNQNLDRTKLSCLDKKGHVPWELIKDVNFLLEEKKRLPKIKHFYSTLNESNISMKEWENCQIFYEKFECKNLAEYITYYCWTGKIFKDFMF